MSCLSERISVSDEFNCTHTRQGLFQCTHCANTYTTHAAMDTHRLVHQGYLSLAINAHSSVPTQLQICINTKGENMVKAGVHYVANILTGHQSVAGTRRNVQSARIY